MKPDEDMGETQVLTGSSASMDFVPYYMNPKASRQPGSSQCSKLEVILIGLVLVLLLCVCVLSAIVISALTQPRNRMTDLEIILPSDTAKIYGEESYPVLEEEGQGDTDSNDMFHIKKVKRNLTEHNYLLDEMRAMEMADSIARLNHDFARRYPRDKYSQNNIKHLPTPLRQVSDDMLNLSAEQKVTEIIFSMDRDKSGSADPWEMYNWIVWVEGIAQRHIRNEQWASLGRNSTFNILTWSDYQALLNPLGVKTADDQRRQIRDRRRWEFADDDRDDALDKFEFMYFLFPQLNPQSGIVLIPEAHADLDTDHDQRVSLYEYLAIYEGKSDLTLETDHFRNTLDVDRNGYLDVDELAPWVDPLGFVQAKTEVIYLMESLDSDRNKELTAAEALGNIELFLSSQASYYGDIYKLENLRNEVFRYQRIS
ncbi:hypothetical protein TCAL_01775 [Tigriopus californicus]|uniref:45 kDa calcium-binding protein n=1 Tax=Tigriopus californicus TaxID=6832 RepID=A0A553N7R9_TIGCA|nr:hypothetical protein TCAL_01775 [Tigriopus californicus]|eukprot:TCALIF_01775-PA protein Name:"Similar to RCN3 Reticulocalbin-3 (Homo sapiens)" AED:0.18 eAED:0.18 QI:0/-1/0/1/-1/1/1/0/425